MARKILLADDSVTAQNMGRKILADAGYEVITVNNGSAALKKIGEQRPDVIVLDVYMPGYSGLEVCQRLKETGDTSRIPILLTVGKLEPFKPEEAKRVRADGFIVKPFEASELLSALTKLEDKIVPRNEPSKPGRFARLAAKEEGRFDKTVAVEEDFGWKNRIAFPKKEKEPEPEEPAFTPRNSVKPGVVQTPADTHSPQSSEKTVDVGALATAGLPKDVTPEEIAALAAAAARMKGKIAEEPPQLPASEMAVVAPPAFTNQEDAALASSTEALNVSSARAGIEVRSDSETKTFAENEKPEPASTVADEKSLPDAVTTAILPSPQQASEATSEPVTMAVAAAAGGASSLVSRWTAVAVALEPDEAAISLEQEMQRAYAAFAAAETGHASSPPETVNTPSAPISEAPVPVPAIVAPEASQSLNAVATAATEAVAAAVQELEKVANSFGSHNTDLAGSSTETQFPAPVSEVPKFERPSGVTSATSDETAASNSATASESRLPEVTQGATSGVVPQDLEKKESVAEPQFSAGTHSAAASAEALPTPEPPMTSEQAVAEATAAMAAAVGGRPIEETSSEADPAIASIVDSVLANLRPKIVEEISRKLGKK